MERVMGIEPTPSAWKAEVLPLNYTRKSTLINSKHLRASKPRSYRLHAPMLLSKDVLHC